jgi:Tol biopolymer transport system component
VLGHFDWLDSKTARYFPSQPFQPNVTYTLQMKSGVAGVNGQRVRRQLTWTFQVRPPRVVYITSGVTNRELWTVGLDGASPKQLTHTNSSIFDFDAAPDGDTVAYTAYNEQNGLDLWLIDRDGSDAHRLLDCGKDRCQAPVWSPDSSRIAYSRQSTGLTQNGPLGAPRPWLANVQTGETSPVYTDTQIIGYGASWSPDGKWLASSDGIKGEIHLLDLDTRKVISFTSNTGMLGSWSPDSRYLLYTNIVSGDTDPRTVVMQADLTTGAIITLFGETTQDRDYGYQVPAWSPAGSQIVLSLKADAASPANQLWLLQQDLIDGPMIAAEPGYTYDFYHWDPWGQALVFERAQLGAKYSPEVVVWHPDTGLQVIAKEATQPLWLP